MSRARGSEPEGAPVALSADELRACGAQEDETYQTAVYAQADSDYSVLTLVPGEGDLAGLKVGVVPVAAGSDDTDIVALPASAMAARRRAGKAVPHRFVTSKAEITSEARSEYAVGQAQDAGEDGVVPVVEVCLVRAGLPAPTGGRGLTLLATREPQSTVRSSIKTASPRCR